MPGLFDSYIPQVQGFEGFTPKASWDYKQYTNGFGTRAQYPGEVIDRDTAASRFNDEWGNAASSVNTFAPDAPDGVKAALASLTFNAGPEWMKSGLGTAVKNGDYDTAKNIFLQYNRAGGKVNPGLVSRRQQEAQWFSGAQPSPGRMALGGPIPQDSEDNAPMPGGLLSSGTNMAKFLPPAGGASPIMTGSLPGGATGMPVPSGPGGLLSTVGDKLTQALQNPLFQFGVGMAGAGGEGKGIGGGLLGGSQNANEAFKTALAQRSIQAMQQRDKFIQSLSDPNNPLSRVLSPELKAILQGLPPDQGAPVAGSILEKSAEMQLQRKYAADMLNQFTGSQSGAPAAPSPPPVSGARQAKDGNWYVPDPSRPGKYLMVQP